MTRRRAGHRVDFALLSSAASADAVRDVDADVMCLALSPARLRLALRGEDSVGDAPSSLLASVAHYALAASACVPLPSAYACAIALAADPRVGSPRIVAGARPLETTLKRFFASLTVRQQLCALLRFAFRRVAKPVREGDSEARFLARLRATLGIDSDAAFRLYCVDEVVNFVVNSMRTLDKPHAALCPSRPQRRSGRALVCVVLPPELLEPVAARYEIAAEGELDLVASRRKHLRRTTESNQLCCAVASIVVALLLTATLLGAAVAVKLLRRRNAAALYA
jgi:hypothetical protein